MNQTIKTLVAAALMAAVLVSSSSLAADKAAPKKLTCCQEAKGQKKACLHNCCVTAHRKSESCSKCNPNKEDLEKAVASAKPAGK